jgi:hypothetical protein
VIQKGAQQGLPKNVVDISPINFMSLICLNLNLEGNSNDEISEENLKDQKLAELLINTWKCSF